MMIDKNVHGALFKKALLAMKQAGRGWANQLAKSPHLYMPLAKQVMGSILRVDSDTEDAFQSFFEKKGRHPAFWKDVGSKKNPVGHLKVVLKNFAKNHIREEDTLRRYHGIFGDEKRHISTGTHPHHFGTGLEPEDFYGYFGVLLQNAPRSAEALLHHILEISDKDQAAAEGIAESTIRKRRSDGMKKLIDLIEDKAGTRRKIMDHTVSKLEKVIEKAERNSSTGLLKPIADALALLGQTSRIGGEKLRRLNQMKSRLKRLMDDARLELACGSVSGDEIEDARHRMREACGDATAENPADIEDPVIVARKAMELAKILDRKKNLIEGAKELLPRGHRPEWLRREQRMLNTVARMSTRDSWMLSFIDRELASEALSYKRHGSWWASSRNCDLDALLDILTQKSVGERSIEIEKHIRECKTCRDLSKKLSVLAGKLEKMIDRALIHPSRLVLNAYTDDMLGRKSRESVEQHIKECDECRNTVKKASDFNRSEDESDITSRIPLLTDKVYPACSACPNSAVCIGGGRGFIFSCSSCGVAEVWYIVDDRITKVRVPACPRAEGAILCGECSLGS